MEPDKTFVKKLKAISNNLSVKWETILNRWVIDYKNSDGEVHRITEVKNPNGSYRPLDDRTIELLKRCDYGSKVNDIKYYLSEQYKKSKAIKERIKQQNRDKYRMKSRDIPLKRWQDALSNAERGIYSPSQLDRKIFSIPSSTYKLVNKLGMPHLPAKAIPVNPK